MNESCAIRRLSLNAPSILIEDVLRNSRREISNRISPYLLIHIFANLDNPERFNGRLFKKRDRMILVDKFWTD